MPRTRLKRPSAPPPPMKPAPKPPYVPGETLPIYPTYSTQVIHGVTYKTYLETDWKQVMTEDGISLYDLLHSLPILDSDGFYRYKGTLKDRADITAMQQLYSITDQECGDLYLVETSMVNDDTSRVCETYVWLTNNSGWVYCGTTNKQMSVNSALPEVLQVVPDTIGTAGQIMVVSEDGKSLTWSSAAITDVTESITKLEETVEKINETLTAKADKIIVFNDTLKIDNWEYDESYPSYKYIYESENIPTGSYFEIIPVVNSAEESAVISAAGILGVIELSVVDEGTSYAVIRATNIPTEDITVFIKVYGTVVSSN